MQKEGANRPLLGLSSVSLPEESIQQLFVLVALLGDVVAVALGEVKEPRFRDDILAVGF